MAILDPVLDNDSGAVARSKINNNDANINSDVGTNTNAITALDSAKADKVAPASPSNLAGLDAGGNLEDSGVDPASIFTGFIDHDTSALLLEGSRTITFATPFSDADYQLIINVRGSNGIPSGYTLTAQVAASFTVYLDFDSIVTHIAIK